MALNHSGSVCVTPRGVFFNLPGPGVRLSPASQGNQTFPESQPEMTRSQHGSAGLGFICSLQAEFSLSNTTLPHPIYHLLHNSHSAVAAPYSLCSALN